MQSGSVHQILHQTLLIILMLNQHHHTASAPSFSAQSQDVCATGVSVGIQTFGTGFSGGKTNRDMNCERIKLAKVSL
jgi:hypothetical protein